MINFPIPLLGFAASSGTGKTTLLTKLIPLLNEKGIRLAIIKHSHHNVEIDNPNKDSYKLRKAGAQQTIIASPKRTSIIMEYPEQNDASLEQNLRHLKTEILDLVLVEGFKFAEIPKIELHRKTLNKPYFFVSDKNIIAIATDESLTDVEQEEKLFETRIQEVTQLNINQPWEIAEFVESFIQNQQR